MYLGTCRGIDVYLGEAAEMNITDNVLFVDKRTHNLFYKGWEIGRLNKSRTSFETFDEDKFYNIQKSVFRFLCNISSNEIFTVFFIDLFPFHLIFSIFLSIVIQEAVNIL